MNVPTLIISAIIVTVFLLIIINEIKKAKSGKTSCSCGCSDCSNCPKK